MRLMQIAILLVLSTGIVHSQIPPGTWELSFSACVGSATISTETTGPYGLSISESQTQKYLSLAFRPGYHVLGGFELEPEIYWTAIEQMSPAFSISGNLAYNFPIYTSGANLFVLAGYGIGNAFPVFQGVIIRSSERFDIPVLNLGAGLKFFITEHVALRSEYRYQQFKQDQDHDSGYFAIKRSQSMHNLLFGFSVFLP